MGQRRQVTVLFIDIVGSTELASRTDAEDMADWMEGYYARTRSIIERHHGIVTGYLGDGVVACFGLDSGKELAASYAVAAALEGVEEIAPPPGHDRPVALRAGVATGEVATRAADATGELPPLTGAVPTLAARIQDAGSPGVVLVAEETRALLRGDFVTEARPAQMLKGFPEPQQLHVVTHPEGMTPRRPKRPFLGRSAELARIRTADVPCLVVGEAGIGKSALAAAVPTDEGAHVWLSADGLNVNASHHPFKRWLREVLGDAEPAMEALSQTFPTLGHDTLLPLAMITGLPEGQRLLAEKGNIALKEMIEQSLVAALLAQANAGDWIIIEDLHWLDNASFGVVRALIDHPDAAKRRILMTSRDDGKFGTHLGDAELETVRLAPLTQAESAALVAAMAGAGDVPDDDVEKLIETAGGIPLFLEQLYRHGLVSGNKVPATLMDLLAERIDSIGAAKPVLQQAAILGARFSVVLLADMLNVQYGEIQPLLETAEDQGVVRRETSDIWQFAHALLHQATYHGILRKSREMYHARVAAVITENHPDTAARDPAILAEHHARAREYVPAVQNYLAASRAAVLQGALADAEAHARSAIDLGQSAPAEMDMTDLEIAAHTALGSVLMQSQGFCAPEVLSAFETVREIAATGGTPGHDSAPALLGSFTHAIIAGDMDGAEAICATLDEMAPEPSNSTDYDEVRLAAHAARNGRCFYAGDFDKQYEQLAQIRARYDLAEHGGMILNYGMDIFAAAQMFEPVSRAICGQGHKVQDLLAETDAHQRRLDIPVMKPYALIWGAVPLFYIGETDAALDRLNRGIAEAENQGAAFWQITGRVWLGVMTLDGAGNPEGLAAFREAIETLEGSGVGIVMPYFRAVHALGLCQAAETEAAYWQSKQAAMDCETSRLLCWYAEILRLHGTICLATGRREEADHTFSKGLEVAERQGANLWRLRILSDLPRPTPGQQAARLSLLRKGVRVGDQSLHSHENIGK
ncbi:MAG: ATP-binding protein [Pseudomonadota bacterium]